MGCCGAGEADDRLGTLDLPGSQLPLLQALQAAAPDTPIVLVLLNGGPLSSPWAYSNAQAVLEAWWVECVCVVQMMPGGCVAHVSRLPSPVIDVGDAVAWQVPWVLGGPGDRGRFVRGGVSSGSTAGDDRERCGPAAAVHGLCDVDCPGPHALVRMVWCV